MSKPALVLFHMAACRHSKNMMEDWEKAKNTLLQAGLTVLDFGHEEHPQEIHENVVTCYPTIRFYPEGFPGTKYFTYKGNRTTASFLKFVHSEGQDA